MPATATVSVNPLPALHTVTGGGNYCIGGTGVAVGLNGTDAGISYQLYHGSGAVGSPLTGSGPAISFGLQTVTGSYTVQATNSTTGCVSSMPGSATVTISATPTIYSVTGGGSYCASGPGVPVGLGGSDPGISYQLYNGGPAGPAVTGTGSAISFGLETPGGAYTVIATGSIPTCVATMSGAATVGISHLPAVHNVTGGRVYCSGGSGVHVGLDVADAGISYQLYNGSTPIGPSLAGSGAPLDFGLQAGAGTYSVRAANMVTGCISAMAGSALVAMSPVPVVYAMAGGGPYCAGGAGAGVQLGGSQTGIVYQLYLGSAVVGGLVPGTGAMLDFGPQPAGVYSVVAANPVTGCASNMTGSATVNISLLPVPHTVTGGGAYCAGGGGVHVQLDGSSTGVSYQLYNGAATAGPPVMGTGTAIDFGLKTASGYYTVTATNTLTGCVSIMTGAASVISNPAPASYAVSSSSPAYCAGGSGVTISLTGSDAGVYYQLYRGAMTSGAALPGAGGLLSFGPQSIAGSYTVVATNASSGCTAHMPGVATVAINAAPAVYAVTGGGAYCSGGPGVHVSLSGSVSGILYQLQRGTTTSGGPVTGTGAVLDFGPQTIAGNYTVAATNPLTGCSSSMAGSTIVGINASPVAQTVTGGGSYCAGGSGVNVALSSSLAGTNYRLYLGSTAIGTVAYGNGMALNFGLQTTAGAYTVVATNPVTGCTNNMSGSALVAINPVPAIYAVTGGGAYCAEGAGLHVGLSNSGTGIGYQLYNGTLTIGGAVSGTGSPLDFGIQTGSGSYTVQATDLTSGCMHNMAGSAAIAINELPAVYPVTGGGSYCSGGLGVHTGLGGSATGVDYTLHSAAGVSTLHGTGAALDFGLQTGPGTYTATALNTATGCVNNMSGSVTVTVSPSVAPSVTISSANGHFGCTGRMSTFSAVPVNGGPSPAYQWAINGTAAGAGYSYSYIPLDGDIVTVNMGSNAHCAFPGTASAGMLMAVNTLEMPAVSVTADPGTEVCRGTDVTFTAVSSFAGSAPRYAWFTNGVPDLVSTTGTYNFTPADGDSVYCVLHSNYYCRMSDSGISNGIRIKTDGAQTPVVLITSDNGGNVSAGVQKILTANVTNAGPSPSFQWYVNGNIVPAATLPVFESRGFSDQDVVTCEVTGSGPCPGNTGSGSITIHVWKTGLQQAGEKEDLVGILPNPNKGSFRIVGTLASAGTGELTIKITDLLGHVIYMGAAKADNGKIEASVQLDANIADGVYLLNVQSEAHNNVFQVVVTR